MAFIFKIAVSGGAASGKTSVCNYFIKKQIKVVSLDKLSHQVVEPEMPAYKKIVDYFGKDVVLEDGILNRPVLREMITNSPDSKKVVEDIVQPEVLHMMEKLVVDYESDGEKFVVIEVPLLFELGMEKMFDANILVFINKTLQIERLMKRDGVTKEGAESLINIQMDQGEKLKRAEYIVENVGELENLYKNTEEVFKKIAEKAMNVSKSLDR